MTLSKGALYSKIQILTLNQRFPLVTTSQDHQTHEVSRHLFSDFFHTAQWSWKSWRCRDLGPWNFITQTGVAEWYQDQFFKTLTTWSLWSFQNVTLSKGAPYSKIQVLTLSQRSPLVTTSQDHQTHEVSRRLFSDFFHTAQWWLKSRSCRELGPLNFIRLASAFRGSEVDGIWLCIFCFLDFMVVASPYINVASCSVRWSVDALAQVARRYTLCFDKTYVLKGLDVVKIRKGVGYCGSALDVGCLPCRRPSADQDENSQKRGLAGFIPLSILTKKDRQRIKHLQEEGASASAPPLDGAAEDGLEEIRMHQEPHRPVLLLGDMDTTWYQDQFFKTLTTCDPFKTWHFQKELSIQRFKFWPWARDPPWWPLHKIIKHMKFRDACFQIFSYSSMVVEILTLQGARAMEFYHMERCCWMISRPVLQNIENMWSFQNVTLSKGALYSKIQILTLSQRFPLVTTSQDHQTHEISRRLFSDFFHTAQWSWKSWSCRGLGSWNFIT